MVANDQKPDIHIAVLHAPIYLKQLDKITHHSRISSNGNKICIKCHVTQSGCLVHIGMSTTNTII